MCAIDRVKFGSIQSQGKRRLSSNRNAMARDLTMEISAIADITRRVRTGSPTCRRHMRRVARCNATGRLRGRSGADRCNVGQAVERRRSGPRHRVRTQVRARLCSRRCAVASAGRRGTLEPTHRRTAPPVAAALHSASARGCSDRSYRCGGYPGRFRSAARAMPGRPPHCGGTGSGSVVRRRPVG